MPLAEFEPAIPMFERPKTVLALDHAAIETGANGLLYETKIHEEIRKRHIF
jgi:hypothetical protein